MTSMTNADDFLDYVRQRASFVETNTTFYTNPYSTTMGINIEKEKEQEEEALSDIHIFDPEDLFL